MRALTLGLVSLAWLAGCAHGGWGAAESEPLSDSGWRAYTSGHFVLYTDQSDFIARSMIEELERGVQILAKVAFPDARLPRERIDVLLFDRADQLQVLSGDKQRAGAFIASDDVTAEAHLLVVSAPDRGVLAERGDLREMVLHEASHDFVRHVIPHAPTWLNEGIATYWMTMQIEGNSTEVIVGRPPYLTQMYAWPSLAELIHSDARQFYDRPNRLPYYSAAWGLVHHLLDRYPTELARFEALLAVGRDQAAAWREAFAVSPEQLEHEVRERYQSDEGLARRLVRPLMPAIDPESVRPLDPAEVRILWARATAMQSEGLARAQAELDAAEKLRPDLPEVQLWQARLAMARGRTAEVATRAERGLMLRPADPALLELLAMARAEQNDHLPEAERTLAPLDDMFARLAAVASSASGLALVGQFTLVRHGADAALPLAEKAVARNGECVPCLELLARVRHARHDEPGAAEAESRAIAAWPRESAPTALLRRLERYQKAGVPVGASPQR